MWENKHLTEQKDTGYFAGNFFVASMMAMQ
jgi:hypothetical protein